MGRITPRMCPTLSTLMMWPFLCWSCSLSCCLSCWSKLSKVPEATFLESLEQISKQKGRPQHRRRRGRRKESGDRTCWWGWEPSRRGGPSCSLLRTAPSRLPSSYIGWLSVIEKESMVLWNIGRNWMVRTWLASITCAECENFTKHRVWHEGYEQSRF